ncbi:MAG: hypothetical protein H6706_10620 [Myxococcales bacterium]|nr:hypothetical protein [Myxococcales bacterium]
MRKLWWLLALAACDDGPRAARDAAAPDAGIVADQGADARPPADAARPPVDGAPPPDAGPPADAAAPDAGAQGDDWVVEVTLDGVPAAGVRVQQGGLDAFTRTDADGRARLVLDRSRPEEPVIIASHPDARIRSMTVYPEDRSPALIELARFSTADNPAYAFQDPGEPRRRESTAQCGHCHLTLNDDWYASPHRRSASNPTVHDLYAGTASGRLDAAACAAVGGRFGPGPLPGGGEGPRCVVADGVADGGECADCHAPGIDGRLGGRALSEATGRAFEAGVHCDVCHRVADVDLEAAAPGVAGRLRLLRPVEDGPISLGAGGRLPLTFGPSHDSPNPRMGSVQRDHFRDGRICAGCHQHEPAQAADRDRWPSGRLPVQTTWAEWQGGALGEAMACNDCHMPPAPEVANGGDLQAFPLALVGVQGGFVRPAGAVRHHTWVGPRTPASGMLALAAALFIEREVVDGELVARVTLRNQGAGHGLPTGEPMRAVLVTVQAFCGDEPLAASGGDSLPGWAGARAQREGGEDWAVWPEAAAGMVIRVTRRTGEFHDYEGFGPFGDGTFGAAAKGLPVEVVVGEAEVTSVAPDGTVTLSQPLPAGERAWLGDATWLAGAPGFAYARVLVDAAGNEMVPHFRAVDVRSDDRLLPLARHTSTHRFRTRCPEPTVVARVVHRPYPLALATERGWAVDDQVMVEVRR